MTGPFSPEPVTTLLADTFAIPTQPKGLRIWVSRPLQPPPAGGHAVLFMFDARAYFAGVTEITRLMSLSHEIAPLIVVGIGHDAADYAAQVERRMYDLTLSPQSPLSFPRGGQGGFRTGGAPDLLDFIAHELKPFLAARYPMDLNRTVLFGHSLGGHVVLHEALTRPERYAAFVASSPAVWADADAVSGDLKTSLARRMPTRLFISAGEHEGAQSGHIADGVRRLGADFEGGDFGHLDSRMRILADETHTTAVYAALPPALRWALRDWPVDKDFDLSKFQAP
ncbi:MAG: alpha/beta hydrolase-fold protein [Rhizomicrobium sp.]